MNILHFGRFYSGNFGGIERHVATLLDCLKPVMKVCNIVANETCKSEVVNRDGYDIHKIASLGVLAGTALCPTMPYRARRLYEREGCDIVHLHFPDPLAHLAYYFLPKSGEKIALKIIGKTGRPMVELPVLIVKDWKCEQIILKLEDGKVGIVE